MSSNSCNMAIFRLLKMGPPPSWILLFSFLTVGTVKSAELRYYAKFYRINSNRGRDIVIFGFFKMAAAVILDCKLLKFLTVGHAKKVEPLHCAKFRLNRSNPGRHMVIFIIQDGGRRRHHWFLKFPIFNDRNGQEGRTVSWAKFRRNRSNRSRDM